MKKECLLITGAAGRVGSYVTPYLAERYELVLTDRREPASASAHGQFVQADLTHPGVATTLCEGVDRILHLASENVLGTWEALLDSDLKGFQLLLEAASNAGCRRVVFTSTIQVIGGHTHALPIPVHAMPHPESLYGVAKAGAEALAAYYAHQRGLPLVCVRLGWVAEMSRLLPDERLDIAITYPDALQLLQCALDAPPSLSFAIVQGLSDNRIQRMDIHESRELLGYDPQHDAYLLAAHNQRRVQWDALKRHLHRLRRLPRRFIRLAGQLNPRNASGARGSNER